MVLFKGCYVGIAAKTKVPEGFRHARAHVARMVFFDRESFKGQVRHVRASDPRGLLGQDC